VSSSCRVQHVYTKRASTIETERKSISANTTSQTWGSPNGSIVFVRSQAGLFITYIINISIHSLSVTFGDNVQTPVLHSLRAMILQEIQLVLRWVSDYYGGIHNLRRDRNTYHLDFFASTSIKTHLTRICVMCTVVCDIVIVSWRSVFLAYVQYIYVWVLILIFCSRWHVHFDRFI
jgi:hypothetical protein